VIFVTQNILKNNGCPMELINSRLISSNAQKYDRHNSRKTGFFFLHW